MPFYVYKITNKINGKLYVGQTVHDVRRRFSSHCSPGSGGRSAVKAAIMKYGKEHFTLTVLSECATLEQLNDAEAYWIDHFQTMVPSGYNLVAGGNNAPRSSEVGAKISAAKKGKPSKNKGKKLSIEHREALSIAHIGLPTVWSGRRHTEESRAKMSRARKGISNVNSGNFKKGVIGPYAFKKGGLAPNKGRTRVIVDGKVRYLKAAA